MVQRLVPDLRTVSKEKEYRNLVKQQSYEEDILPYTPCAARVLQQGFYIGHSRYVLSAGTSGEHSFRAIYSL